MGDYKLRFPYMLENSQMEWEMEKVNNTFLKVALNSKVYLKWINFATIPNNKLQARVQTEKIPETKMFIKRH